MILSHGTEAEQTGTVPANSHAAADRHEEWPALQPEDDAVARSWLPSVIAVLAVAGWTGFFLWANMPQLRAAAAPALWAGLVAQWAIVTALVVALWLVVMRSSRREALRFGGIAQMLQREATTLEQRLATVNRELSLARDFMAGQSRDLESLGRVAVDRLSSSGQKLQSLIGDNMQEVEAIGRISTHAAANMEKVRNDLPVLGAAMRDLTNRIGLAGQAAGDQVNALTEAVERLGESGDETEAEVASLRTALEGTIAELIRQSNQLAGIAEQRMAALEDRSRGFVTQLRASEGEADAAWNAALTGFEERMNETLQRVGRLDQQTAQEARERLAALHEEAVAVERSAAERLAQFEGERRQREVEAAEREASATIMLREQFEMLDAEIARRQQEHVAQVERLVERGEALAAGLSAARGEGTATLAQIDLLEQRLSALPAQAEAGAGAARSQLAATMVEVETLAEALEQRIAAAREQALARIDNGFAAAMTAILQRLNSEAIDLTRIFAGEIEEGDWNAYLAGDHGRFTRRAVRLLDAGEAGRIAGLHDGDAAFQEAVDNYLHDFELLLREVLATRAGNPLAVTLLSSDMGKLYVALAQATERLAE
ncbi:hypothetical protein [Croceibacterium ferulae]|uniref:hypothetical protein n=1 Tax=Croceibacterium ferulae TaxID=1854641 RepID=UPI000F86F793|nr:hypothetical protein [Croceibacterium ferulae]